MSSEIQGIPLYRFEPACLARIEALKDGQLWISDPARFNDPFDLKLEVSNLAHRTGFDESNLRRAAEVLFKDVDPDSAHWIFSEEMLETIGLWIDGNSRIAEIAHSLKEHIRSFGVQCFSSRYSIPLSWAHYASRHKGFCIEYDLSKMSFAMSNTGFSMFDVTYVSQLPEVCVSEVLFTPHQALAKLLATKTTDWAYEQEFRLVNFRAKGGKVQMPEGLRMASLIGGMEMSGPHLDALKAVGKHLGVPVYKMVQSRTPANEIWHRHQVFTPED